MDKTDEAIFDFAYELALRDAASQKAYEGGLDCLRACAEAKLAVRDYIETILSADKSVELDWAEKEFDKTENKVRRAIDPESDKNSPATRRFTFGNSQKLINMTAKYLYISTFQAKDKRERFRLFHCPMDSIMIAEAKKILVELRGDKVPMREVLKEQELISFIEEENEKEKAWKTRFSRSWSTLERTSEGDPLSPETRPIQYRVFQKVIRYCAVEEGLSPIEYDYFAWQRSL